MTSEILGHYSNRLKTALEDAAGGIRGDKEPWAPDTELIVPVQSTQALIHESAVILGAETFLKIAGLPYTLKERANATEVSPTGKLPVLRCGSYVVSELEGIVQLAHSKGIQLSGHLSGVRKADVRACMSLVQNKLGPALLYLSWMDEGVYRNYTRIRTGSPYYFPLSVLIPWTMRKRVVKQLDLLGWGERTLPEVYWEVETCLVALDEYLGDSPYFFGASPTELDALVFGYLHAMISTRLPNQDQLSNLVRQQRNLRELCRRMEKEYFSQKD